MANGNTTYDYDAIDECNQLIRQKVTALNTQADTYTRDSTALVNQFWGGEAAQIYDVQAKDIIRDLVSLVETLGMVGRRFDDGALRMVETDMRGARQLGGV